MQLPTLLAQLLPISARPLPTAEQVGMKAVVLARLLEAGFPVPRGLCVTTEAFRMALAPYAQTVRAALHNADLSDPAAAQAVAHQAQTLLANLTLPIGLRLALRAALPAFGEGPLAVRSSATHEDLPGASFAGQYYTRLGVIDLADLEAAILDCWRSFFSPHALAARAAYASSAATPDTDPAMAVLIQPLLDAECSGVCFSVDPVQWRPDTLLIVSTWGLGLGVVDGSIPADSARLRRDNLSLETVVSAVKRECIRPNAAGGTQRAPVPPPQQRPVCLPVEWLQAIAAYGLALEQSLGWPQDVEWSIRDNQVWILQSRPITALPPELVEAVRFPVEWADEKERRTFWHLASLPNFTPGTVLSPAEIDYTKAAFEGGDAAVVNGGGDRTFWRLYANGRLYMAPAESPVSPGDRRVVRAAYEDLYARLEQQEITLWDYWGPEIVRATERLAAFDPLSADGPALADHLEDTIAAARRHWMIHTIVPRRRNVRLLDLCEAMTGVDRAEAERRLSLLLQGEETVQTRLIDALYDLACLARDVPEVAALLAQQPPDLYVRLKKLPPAAEFIQCFERSLAVYGDRPRPGHGTDIALEMLPWRETPEWALEMVAQYLRLLAEPAHEAPAAARRRAQQQRDQAVEALCASAPQLASEFRRWLAYARRNAVFTDEHNHYIDQLASGQFVQALLYAGRWLAARGDLPAAKDVVWLRVTEIVSALRGPARQSLATTLAGRQREHAAWHRLQAPAILGLPSASLPARRPNLEATAMDEPARVEPRDPVLLGQGVSPGRRSGRARLVPAAASLPAVSPGDVLVAADAGAQWTPLFPILAGVVLDSGSAGQHAAITAREFGVPAVFGTDQATQRIRDGAWITLDGTLGTVEWSEASADGPDYQIR